MTGCGRRRRRIAGPLLVGVTGLVLAGCTALPGLGGAPQPQPGGAPAGVAPNGPDPSGIARYAGLPVLATLTGTDPTGIDNGPVEVQVDLNAVRATAGLTELTLTVRNIDPRQRWQVADFLNDGVNAGWSASGYAPTDGDTLSADGLFLVDPESGRRLLPGRYDNLACACSGGLSGLILEPGMSAEITAPFAPLPPEVATVDVSVPTLGVFPGVEVTRDAPAQPGPAAGSGADPLPVLGSRLTTVQSNGRRFELRIELNGLTVVGDRMETVFTMHNLSVEGQAIGRDGLQVAFLFSAYQATGNAGFNDVDGVEVTDTTAARRYLPAETTSGTCACSTDLGGSFVPEGGSIVLSSVSAAPPAGVRTLDVLIPRAGVFVDVPVDHEGPALDPQPTAGRLVVGPPDEPIAQAPVLDIHFPEASADGAVVDTGDGGFQLASDVLFDFDRSDLTARADEELDRIAGEIRTAGARRVTVVGHTDDAGEDAYNLQLSRSRADAVRTALAAALGSGVTVSADGRGEQEPIADNATDAGRALNRRVDIQVG